jgi:hypothetical protein
MLFGFYRIPNCIGSFESVFRAIVNRSRVYPPGGLVRHFCGRVAEWRAGPPFLWRAGLLTTSWRIIHMKENSWFKTCPYS